MLGRKLAQNQRGETIVEVAICLAILSLVLVSAFILTNKNQSTNRTSQERSEATKELESQVELLRAYTSTKKLAANNDPFCLEPQGSEIKALATCLNKDLYRITIEPVGRPDTCAANSYYHIKIDWDSLIKNTPEELSTYYRSCNSEQVAFTDSVGAGGGPPRSPPIITPTPTPTPTPASVRTGINFVARFYLKSRGSECSTSGIFADIDTMKIRISGPVTREVVTASRSGGYNQEAIFNNVPSGNYRVSIVDGPPRYSLCPINNPTGVYDSGDNYTYFYIKQ